MTNPERSAANGPDEHHGPPSLPDPTFAGRQYPPLAPTVVSAEKIAEFARSTSATSELHLDARAARASGYADVVAPPTFLVSLAQRCEAQYIEDPEAGIDFSRVVHGEEKFVLSRPVVAGDVLQAVLHVDSVRQAGGHSMVTTRVEMTGDSGEHVATVTSTLVVRGED